MNTLEPCRRVKFILEGSMKKKEVAVMNPRLEERR